MMRIAMILPSLAKNGPGIQVSNLIEFFQSQDMEVEIFFIKSCRGNSLNVGALKSHKVNVFNVIKAVRNFDVIHSHGFFPDLFSALLGIIFKKKAFVTTMHNFINEDFDHRYGGMKGKIYSNLWYKILKFIPNVIVFTNVAKIFYQNKLSGVISVIPSSIPINQVVERSKNHASIPSNVLDDIFKFKSKGYKIIGANSIITKVKGLDLIIRSLPFLDDFVVIFVGGGDDEYKLQQLSRRLGVHERCVFVGFQSDPLPFLLYYDVYAAPSMSESFGLSLFEAIACKVPVVCSTLEVFKELLTRDSVFFMENTIESFVKSVNRACDVDEAFLKNAFNLVRNNYDSHVIAAEYKKLYLEITENVKF